MKKKIPFVILEFNKLKIVAGGDNGFMVGAIQKEKEQALTRNNNVYYVHKHVYYEIFIVADSPLTIFTDEGKKVYQNKILIIPPTLNHCAYSSDGNVYRISVSVQNQNYSDSPFGAVKGDGVTALEINEDVIFYFRKLVKTNFSSSSGKIKGESLVKIVLIEIIDLLSKNKEDACQEYSDKYYYAEQIDKYVNEHYVDGGASISGLAKRMFLSERQVSRLVKKVYGCTFPQIINRRRMQAAATLLKNSDYRVEEIIDFLGIENKNYFFVAFKKFYGVSPLKYKNDQKSGEKESDRDMI